MVGRTLAREWPRPTVARLAKRDGGHCAHCGATSALVVQHRANRGMGGDPTRDRPSNTIILCWAFNDIIERDAEAAEYARAYGWKLRSTDDPERVPYLDVLTGWWLLLADDGLPGVRVA